MSSIDYSQYFESLQKRFIKNKSACCLIRLPSFYSEAFQKISTRKHSHEDRNIQSPFQSSQVKYSQVLIQSSKIFLEENKANVELMKSQTQNKKIQHELTILPTPSFNYAHPTPFFQNKIPKKNKKQTIVSYNK